MAIDRELTLKNAERSLRAGRFDAAIAEYARLVEDRPASIAEHAPAIRACLEQGADAAGLAALGYRMIEFDPDAATACAEMAADAHVSAGAYPKAAAVLREFAVRAPARVPLLLRLVEVCVDGGLEPEMFDAQLRLTEAYLLAGQAAEARSMAEDLAATNPADPEQAARLRCTLEMLGPGSAGVAAADRPPAPADRPPGQTDDNVDIDLTNVLGDLQNAAAPAPRTLESVFEGLRADDNAADDNTAEHLGLARTYMEMGMPGDAASALEVAARSPRHRFIAASMLAQIHRDNSDLPKAIEWFERAAEAPAPTPEDGRSLLYDLADVLETLGETARALAVLLELQTDDPGYRDVGERVTRLSKVETEG